MPAKAVLTLRKIPADVEQILETNMEQNQLILFSITK